MVIRAKGVVRYVPAVVVVLLLLLGATAACRSEPAPASLSPGGPSAGSSAGSSGGSSEVSSGGKATVGQLAAPGATVFRDRCSRCHGANGEGLTGPALIGPNAGLAKYSTGRSLWDFLKTSMPFDAPGKLSHDEYRQVMSFILLQNKLASADVPFDESALEKLALVK